MTPVHGVDVSDCLYWAVGASPLAARCHVMGPSLSPSRLGDLTGHYGGPRGRPGPPQPIPAAGPDAYTAPGARPPRRKRPEAQGGRTLWLLRLAIMCAFLHSAGLFSIERH